MHTVHSTKPPYTGTLHLPGLTWAAHPRVAARANAAVKAWAAGQVTSFAAAVVRTAAGPGHPPASLPVSSLSITSQTTLRTTTTVSYRFLVEPYVRGMVGLAQVPAGLTFDLRDGRRYTLAQLFRAGTPYLPTLAPQAGKGLAAFSPSGARCSLGQGPAAYCGAPTITLVPRALRAVASATAPLGPG